MTAELAELTQKYLFPMDHHQHQRKQSRMSTFAVKEYRFSQWRAQSDYIWLLLGDDASVSNEMKLQRTNERTMGAES